MAEIDDILEEYNIEEEEIEEEERLEEINHEIKINGVVYTRDLLCLMFEGVYDGINVAEYNEIKYDKDDNPSGIKPIPYVARKIIVETLNNNWSDYLYSASDNRWLRYHKEEGIWEILVPQKVYQIFLRKWYENLPHIRPKQNYEVLVSEQYKRFATINGKEGENIYDMPEKNLIPLKNGILDYKNELFRDYRKSDFMTTKIPRQYIQNCHEPTHFEKLLNDILPIANQDVLKRCIYGFIGSLIRGYNLDQWMLFLISKEGGTGKGTLTTIFTKILGRENVVEVRLDDLEKYTHATSYLLNKRLILASETESDNLDSLKMMKRISGGDEIPFNPKHRTPFSRKPIGQILVTTNNVPGIDPSEKAFWRRPMIINLDKKPYTQKEYENLLEKILDENELDRIANKALSMLDKTAKIQDEYHSAIDNKELYENNLRNYVFEFFEYIIVKDGTSYVAIDDLRKIYNIFRECEGLEPENLQEKGFKIGFSKMLAGFLRSRRIKKEIIREKRGEKYIKLWKGIALREEELENLQNIARDTLKKDFKILSKIKEDLTAIKFTGESFK